MCPARLRCSPGQMQSLNRYNLYDADRPVYCPLLGLCETHLLRCKAVGGFSVVGCWVTKIKRFLLLTGGSLEVIRVLLPKIALPLKI